MFATKKSQNPAKTVAAPYQSAANAIGKLEPGCRVFGFNKGQFSLIDILAHALDCSGPADVTLCCWTAGAEDILRIRSLMERGIIRSFRLLIDRSFAMRKREYEATVSAAIPSARIRAVETHAKFATIHNDTWSLVIRGSMNLNRNPRFEQFDIDDDKGILEFVNAIADEMFAIAKPGLKTTKHRAMVDLRASMAGGMASTYDAGDDDTEISLSALAALPPMRLDAPAVGEPLTLPDFM